MRIRKLNQESRKILIRDSCFTLLRDATSRALGVNPIHGVQSTFMSDPLMQKNSSSDTLTENSPSPRSLFFYIVVALALALSIRFFIATPYLVSGASMDPTFEDMNYLIVDRVSYTLGEPKRGDVIIFDLPENPSKSLIKRVIGLPGDTVNIQGNTVRIQNAEHPNGFVLDEPYIDSENLGGVDRLETTLEPGQYFVLGDNRHVSADSRIWGKLPREYIVGRAFLRLYPFDHVNILPGEARYEE